MAAARPLVGRASVTENVIKQGYLKKSVRSSDPILSAPKQLATNIKQKLEPSRWYVFGVRYGQPYLEFFESEEKVFSHQPLEVYDLSTYRNLTYTLGRTNTNYTFCIFLEYSTIELTAHNRAQMIDWCRTLERHLRNLGIGNKKAREDHTYTAFPVQPKPPTRSGSLEDLEGLEGATAIWTDEAQQENEYEDPDSLKLPGQGGTNRKSSSPPLPPRPRKSNDDDDVFASLNSVHKLPNNEYDNVRDTDALVNDDIYEDSDRDTLKASEQSPSHSGLNGNLTLFISDCDEDEDRCSSMPAMPSKVPESDTSEDSDFVSASFWLRNRKKEDLMAFDDSALETVREKRDSAAGDKAPLVPMRARSMKSDNRRCVSMYSAAIDVDVDESLFKAPAANKPVPKPRKTAVHKDVKDLNQNDVTSKHKAASDNDCITNKSALKGSGGASLGKAVDKLGDKVELDDDDDDDGAYEALVNATTPKQKVVKAEEEEIYETTWGSATCSEGSAVGQCKTDGETGKKYKTKDDDPDAPLVPPKRKGIAKYLSRKLSSKKKPLPEALVVSLPPRPSDVKAAKGGSDAEEDILTPTDGNLYTDMPDGSFDYGSGAANSKTAEPDTSVLKISPTKDSKSAKQTSPVLPRRNMLSSSVSSTRHVPSEYITVPKSLSQSYSETRSKNFDNDISADADADVYEICNGDLSSPAPPTSHSETNLYSSPDSAPVAPPRRNKKTGKGSNITANSEHGKHTTVISCKPTSYELASTLPVGEKAISSMEAATMANPPLPPRLDSLPGKQAVFSKHDYFTPPPPSVASIPDRSGPLPLSVSGAPERPAAPLPSVFGAPDRPPLPLPSRDSPADRPPLPLPGDGPPERPAPPPPVMRRNNISRSQSDDMPGPRSQSSGARPKTAYMVNRQPSQLGMNLKQNQVDVVKAERDSTGGMVRMIPKVHFQLGLALVQCYDRVWIAGWDVKKYPRLYDKFHIGDELIAVNDVQLVDLSFAYKLVKNIKADHLEVTVRRLPLARIYAIQRAQEGESIGIKREGGTAEIVYVDPYGLAATHGLSSKATTVSGGLCTWTLTEINMRPLNLFYKDNEIEHRLLAVGRDISIIVQPTDFIKELKKQLKKIRGYKDYIVQ